MINVKELYVFIYYGAAVLAPFLLFCCISSACRSSKGPSRSLTVVMCQYVGKFPLLITLFHLVLTVTLSAYCIRDVAENMGVAVDLNYYTKTYIRATEAYDAILDGKYDKSFYNWYFHEGGRDRRKLQDKFKDLVAVYHSSSSSWNNVLTFDNIIDMCLAEKQFLSSQSCIGSEVSSLLQTVMTEDCAYKRTYEEALLVFGLEENAAYVEDNVDPSHPKSAVILSYYATSCKLKLESVDSSVSAVEVTYGSSTHMAYAHSDLVTDAFVASGLNDVRLSLLAMAVCFGVLSISVGLKFLYGLLFMLCIVFSLAVAAGCLPIFGFSYFSAFNVLAIFVITGVGADAIIVFCTSWYKCIERARIDALSNKLVHCHMDTTMDHIDLVPLFPLVLYNSYTSVVAALSFTVMTTILSFLANLVSPIVVIAQLGAFMGTAMIMYFTLLHLILIPAWIFVAKLDQCFSICAPLLQSLSKLSRHISNYISATTISAQIDDDVTSECSIMEAQSGFSESHISAIVPTEDVDDISVELSPIVDIEVFDEDILLGEEYNSDDEINTIVTVTPMEIDGGERELNCTENEVLCTVLNRKQSMGRGCGIFIGVIITTCFVVYGLTEKLNTDFGLPLLFKEGTNMADLMYVAKNFKSDILTLGNSGGSSVSPDPGTYQPSASPTFGPTPTPTSKTESPTLSPTEEPTILPTVMPTHAPTFLPSHLPISDPSSAPSITPSIAPSFMLSQPSSIPSTSPMGRPTNAPSISLSPSLSPSLSLLPSATPLSWQPSMIPSTSAPSCCPTSAPVTFQPTSAPITEPTTIPSGCPSSIPSVLPSYTPSYSPSLMPSTSPSCEPSSSPSLSVTVAPSGQLDLASTESTLYQVYACYGIDVQQENIDTTPTAKVNAETFGRYAEQGLLSDLQELCDYLSANKDYMEVSMADSDCIYYQLMSVSVDDDREIDVFERVGLWMSQKKERFFQVGVEETGGGVVSGNFGEDLDLWLTFVCQPIPCQAEISSFFKHPDHALTMIDRWDDAVYDEGSASADSMGVISLTASDAWLFPLLSNRIVSSIYISSMISFVGCLVLISVATRNLKLSLLIGFGMLFVMITSLLLHVIFFSSVIDLIDIIVLISFVGIIIDYPTHMAFHYEQDLRLRNQLGSHEGHSSGAITVSGRLAQVDEESFHKKSFGYMRLALIGPAITTIFSAIPLMFAEFSILSKAGEYVVIMCLCTYVYVAFVMPTLLRLVGELVFIPCRYTPEKSLYFTC